ncbi:hypothetical protein LSTR_LSTR012551 [Laodelphax striatellus]|uniref:Guanylate cyclase domain-containing protein n=1 Tax=Laodelphax striatellus TaxID=195883 RepID=A0A482XSX2_LAOST|nr:hypothetical protein LSTR_LSTR012551 [Laodelphax striatellus]
MKKALDEVGGFKMEHRGFVDIKGKGVLDTYWLTCKEGPFAKSAHQESDAYYASADPEPVFMRQLRETTAANQHQLQQQQAARNSWHYGRR